MHLTTSETILRLRDNPTVTLMQALTSARVFNLMSGQRLLKSLGRVIPIDEWYTTTGEDAIAALELADP